MPGGLSDERLQNLHTHPKGYVDRGVLHVLVNGEPVLPHGQHTGALPGRVVRGPGWTGWSRH